PSWSAATVTPPILNETSDAYLTVPEAARGTVPAKTCPEAGNVISIASLPAGGGWPCCPPQAASAAARSTVVAQRAARAARALKVRSFVTFESTPSSVGRRHVL